MTLIRRLVKWARRPWGEVDPVLWPEGKRLTDIVADHGRRIDRLIEQQDQRDTAGRVDR